MATECEYCGKKLKGIKGLKDHQMIVHPTEFQSAKARLKAEDKARKARELALDQAEKALVGTHIIIMVEDARKLISEAVELESMMEPYYWQCNNPGIQDDWEVRKLERKIGDKKEALYTKFLKRA